MKKYKTEELTFLPIRKILSTTKDNNDSNFLHDNYKGENCIRPEYIVFTWILCLIALASSLKLYYLVKTALASVIVLIYAVLIFIIYPDLFPASYEENDRFVRFVKYTNLHKLF